MPPIYPPFSSPFIPHALHSSPVQVAYVPPWSPFIPMHSFHFPSTPFIPMHSLHAPSSSFIPHALLPQLSSIFSHLKNARLSPTRLCSHPPCTPFTPMHSCHPLALISNPPFISFTPHAVISPPPPPVISTPRPL